MVVAEELAPDAPHPVIRRERTVVGDRLMRVTSASSSAMPCCGSGGGMLLLTAEQRARGRRMVEYRRRLVEHYLDSP
jgi:hypothetical protein